MTTGMKKIHLIIIVTVLAAACSKQASETSARLDKLDSRLTALENTLRQCNEDIAAVKALVAGRTVCSCSNSGQVWTLQLSDGSSLSLKVGNSGTAVSPLMSVDAEYYWMMDLGQGPVYVRNAAGEKVSADGTVTVTPLLSADAEGYWTVSLDGGATYSRVKDPAGNAVKAVPQAGAQSSYFADVVDNGSSVTVVLRNGESYTLPVEKGFSCVLDAGADVIYVFSQGTARQFAVTFNGVASHFTQAPRGWTATVEDSYLRITPPESTEGLSAGGIVSLVAVSANGFTSVSSIRVTII